MGYILDHNEESVEIMFRFDFHQARDKFTHYHPADFAGDPETIFKFVMLGFHPFMIGWG